MSQRRKVKHHSSSYTENLSESFSRVNVCYGVSRTKKKHGRLFIERVLDWVARSNRDVSDLQHKNKPWRIIAKRLLQASFEFLFKQSILNRSIKARATMFADNELPMASLISRFYSQFEDPSRNLHINFSKLSPVNLSWWQRNTSCSKHKLFAWNRDLPRVHFHPRKYSFLLF